MTRSQTSFISALSALKGYVAAFEQRDLDGVCALFGEQAVAEIPMLKPNPLTGIGAIREGHALAFEALEEVNFALAPPAESNGHAMAEGVLRTTRVTGERETHHIAVVAEIDGGCLQRLSLYCDERNILLWSDKSGA